MKTYGITRATTVHNGRLLKKESFCQTDNRIIAKKLYIVQKKQKKLKKIQKIFENLVQKKNSGTY